MLIWGMTIGQVFALITLWIGLMVWAILLGRGIGWTVGFIIDHSPSQPSFKKKDE